MSTNSGASKLKSFGGSIPSGIEKAFKWTFDKIALVTLVWWLKPLLRFKYLRPIVRQVPNSLSGLRLLASIPVVTNLALAVVRHDTPSAWNWFIIAIGLALLDAVDGPVATRLDAITDIGKGLDPAADKVFFASLLAGFWYVTLREVGVAPAILFVAPVVWVLNVERHLIALSLPTKRICEQIGVEVPGANVFGKVKFNLQMLAMGGGWISMIKNPTSPTGFLWVLIVLFIARIFADKSLGRHRREYDGFIAQLEEQTHVTHINKAV